MGQPDHGGRPVAGGATARASLSRGSTPHRPVEQSGLDLLRTAAATFERVANRWPQTIDYRFALVRALNAVGDALPADESAEFYRKAYNAAGSIPEAPRNVRDLMNQADVNLRWPRWNASAPAAERRQKLDIAMQALQTLLSYAPNDQSVQKALAEVRRLLVA